MLAFSNILLKLKYQNFVIRKQQYCHMRNGTLGKHFKDNSMSTTTNNLYAVELTPHGEYFAYLSHHKQCFAYGETKEDAIENLKTASEDFFDAFEAVFSLEEYI